MVRATGRAWLREVRERPRGIGRGGWGNTENWRARGGAVVWLTGPVAGKKKPQASQTSPPLRVFSSFKNPFFWAPRQQQSTCGAGGKWLAFGTPPRRRRTRTAKQPRRGSAQPVVAAALFYVFPSEAAFSLPFTSSVLVWYGKAAISAAVVACKKKLW